MNTNHSKNRATANAVGNASVEAPLRASKKYFSLTRKNQKGQVAIFVALIFQVVFVFFALLINVGLLVHHKVNLQHSVDLAAYYGAMKQAQQMNAISHINFQMRQAWKLLTWRYRILGTFGFIKDGAGPQDFPFMHTGGKTLATGGKFMYHGSWGEHASKTSPNTNGAQGAIPAGDPVLYCKNYEGDPDFEVDGKVVGLQDVPFFCVAHSGFNAWPQSESNCKINCSQLNEAKSIPLIQPLATTNMTPFGGDLANAVNTTLTAVNENANEKCSKLGPFGATMLAKFLAAYNNESKARSQTIKALAANLSLDADQLMDIEGDLIKDGSKRTFENNLTEANFNGISEFKIYNGLSDPKCKFTGGDPDVGTQFLKRIEFKAINYYIQTCIGGGSLDMKPEPVYNSSGLSSAFDTIAPELKDLVASFTNPQNYHTIGYEKNPNCEEYFVAKASSQPSIPFLPLSKIKLEAVAVAKPFGGSIGPWYGTKWELAERKSQYNDADQNTKMDATLPRRDTVTPDGKITQSVYMQPNFSLFVGDRLGLRNLDYIAAYHSMLLARDILAYPGTNSDINKNPEPSMENPGKWPDYVNWDELDSPTADFRQYDTLATLRPEEAGMRAIEITAIAPNQYDIYHYSIDPDFYHNYYLKIYKGFDKLKAAAGGLVTITKEQVRPDFGAVDIEETTGFTDPLDVKAFSVKDQIFLKNIVLNVKPEWYGNANGVPAPQPPAGADGNTYNDLLNYVVSLQSSLLTGWTFSTFKNYDATFPNQPVNKIDNTMSFGQCEDSWNKTTDVLNAKIDPAGFQVPMKVNPEFPPAAGNCVTGGRTGYSVKIISPNQISGPDAVNRILNYLDATWLKF